MTTAAATRTFEIDKAHSEAAFQVRHLISKVRGRFSDFDGTIVFDEARPELSTVRVTIRAASIDTGVYLPIVFYPDPPGTFTAISIPGYFWFQVSEKLWLGPMAGLRFVDVGDEHRGHLLLGFGLGYQVASAVDLKTQIFFPQVNTGEGARAWGAGFGVQFRIGE